jgi:hypothetical protein
MTATTEDSREPAGARADERSQAWRRSDRVFAAAGLWFFRTREGIDVGPYPDRERATVEADRLARLHRRATRLPRG